MSVAIARSAFDSTEDPKYLVSDGTLNINGIDCTVFESQFIASANSITSYKAEIRAFKGHNDALYEYLKANAQYIQSQTAIGSNPFKVKSGDYRYLLKAMSLSIGIDSFTIFFEGMLFQPSPDNAII